ncbi:superoxide dismutase family protein [Saccharothrix australiensis]|uniref:Cu-Zn family superoxide dismutase n=1 Tax=Saccharothrix australiensis TaxID=2072 RepID=A0A495VYC2_9PSEU|nr:superoxide dismutase family protein [Saccharothrix australiensis]RKT54326.1 Cu-Zn family superoxide dismutase [Saccharothrix australiensis]
MKRFLPLLGATVALVATAGTATAFTPDEHASHEGHGRGGVVVTTGRFAPPESATNAFTYDTALIEPGSKVMVVAVPKRHSTKVQLSVYGLVPNRTYGSHAHQKPCGQLPADSGAHHQHVVDPVQPSVDPAYANPKNEIWLDFTTDARGRATVTTVVPWQFADRRAGSVVIHAEKTATEPGKAGTAGPRLGCATVKF